MEKYKPSGIINKKIHLSDKNTNSRFSNNYGHITNVASHLIGLRSRLSVKGITQQEIDETIEHLSIHFENFIEYLQDAVKLTEAQEVDVPHLGEE